MKIYLLLLLSLCAQSVRSQGLFEEKYDECVAIPRCLYCGDPLPEPPYNFRRLIIDKIHSSPMGYNFRDGKLMFEILVDSTGHPCVASIDDQVYCADMKKDILMILNDMRNWKPAKVNGHRINSTMILQFDFLSYKYTFHFLKRDEAPKKRQE
jgi:hypothetical protein